MLHSRVLQREKKVATCFFLLKKDSKKSFSFHFFGKPQKTLRAAKSIDAVEWVALLSLDDAALLPISYRSPQSQHLGLRNWSYSQGSIVWSINHKKVDRTTIW